MKWIPVYMVIALLIWTFNNPLYAVDLCDLKRNSVAHVPRADVTYNPSPVQMPARTQIPLTIDMAERYGIEKLPIGTELDAQIGLIEIDEGGQVLYNNNNITGDIDTACNPAEQLINDLANDEQITEE